MNIAFVPVYVDRLGVEAYGLVGFFAVLLAWMALLDMGLSPTLNRELARAGAGAHTAESLRDLVRSVELAGLGLAALAFLLVWSTSAWLAQNWFEPVALDRDVIAAAIGTMALVLATRAIESLYRGALLGMERHVWYNTTVALLATLRAGGAAVVVILVPTIGAFFWWQAAVSVLTVVVLGAATWRFLPPAGRRPKASWTALRQVGGFAGGVALTILLGLLVSQFDKLLLARLLNLDDYGRYMLAVTMAGMLLVIVGPVATATAPRLTAALAHGHEADAARYFRFAARAAATIVMPAAAVCVLMPKELIFGWTGDHALADQVALLLPPLAVAAACNALMTLPYVLQLAAGWTAFSFRLNAAAVTVLLPAVVIAANMAGGVGAAIATAIIWVLLLAACANYMFRRLLPGERSVWILHGLIVPGVLAFGTVAAVAIATDPVSRIGAILSAFVAGTAAVMLLAATGAIFHRRPGANGRR